MGLLEEAQGEERLYLAEFLNDLNDILHYMQFDRRPFTMETFGRIRGIRDEGSIRSIFRRVRAWLKRRKIFLEELKNEETGRTEFRLDSRSRARMERLVAPLFDKACDLLVRERRVRGIVGRERIRPMPHGQTLLFFDAWPVRGKRPTSRPKTFRPLPKQLRIFDPRRDS